MSRPKRICLPNLTYHVSSRCIELRDMLAHDYFKELLIDVMKLALNKYDFEIISYQIMDNHFHFIIRTVNDLATISKIMQYIKSRFAVKYNKIVNRKGPFWNERFKDEIINYCEDPPTYLNSLLWKLAYNSVRKKKVQDPREYRYGCINVYLDEKYNPPIRITYHEYFLSLGNTFLERAQKFLYYKKADLE